jgi:5-formyltetrahydrofolate cyclo-ligase
VDDKQKLREQLRAQRREHVAALPAITKGLLFLRPPAPVAKLVPDSAAVGLYHAAPQEAPTRSYGKWFHENGRTLALPWFSARGAAMQFRRWLDPYDDAALETGPYGMLQPASDAEEIIPDVAFVPLVGFTAACDRLGQGGGHYDRWLEANPQVLPIGLAWDCQLVDSLPHEPHDRRLLAVVTPTRLYEGEI